MNARSPNARSMGHTVTFLLFAFTESNVKRRQNVGVPTFEATHVRTTALRGADEVAAVVEAVIGQPVSDAAAR